MDRRAFFDDGHAAGTPPAGCQIDSIAQSWAVISRPVMPRSKLALQSAETRLVDWTDQVASLFLPRWKTSANAG